MFSYHFKEVFITLLHLLFLLCSLLLLVFTRFCCASVVLLFGNLCSVLLLVLESILLPVWSIADLSLNPCGWTV